MNYPTAITPLFFLARAARRPAAAILLALLAAPLIPATSAQTQPASQLDRLHYEFGHRLLPSLVFRNAGDEYRKLLQLTAEAPDDTVRAILLEAGTIGLTSRWKSLAKQLGATDDNIPPPTGLSLTRSALKNGASALIITFPPPQKSTENYYAAILVDSTNTLRYITYEKFVITPDKIDKLGKALNISTDETKKRFAAVLCEWTPDRKHHNYEIIGTGDKAKFEETLNVLLEKKLSPPATTDIGKIEKSAKQPAPKPPRK